jgi:FtsP/CotA-like multicopper oxidase with cupredoxin domain
MHLHGHHFRSLRTEGPGPAPWRDTLLVDEGASESIALVADNPGRWLIHCHMIEHQAGGMVTWFEVT